ncbi:hypothetical protein R3P38DRAFT_2665265 [Favolaschia claudopus]|uniref:Anaphase-promoting complex subunit 1 n=1 Tax=Favolaschia claudopus TaxID=2862362 RepID=A0AAV9ZDS2_9AGAR
MKVSDSQWVFGSAQDPPILRFLRPHERLELQLLGLVNRGCARGSDGAITARNVDRTLTISDLLCNKVHYAKPSLCIRNSLIIQFGEGQFQFSTLTDRNGKGPICCHTCLPEFMHSLFSIENDMARDISHWTPPQCKCRASEAGDGDSEMDAQELEDLFVSSFLSDITLNLTNCFSAANDSLVVYPKLKAGNVWQEPFVPQPCRFAGLFDLTADLTKSIFNTPSSGSTPYELIVEGLTVAACAQNLISEIRRVIPSGDFSSVLSSDRTFQIIRPNGSAVSFGAGVEREVIYTAFRIFTDCEGAYFTPRYDGRCSIATTMSLASLAFVSSHRLEDLTVLGSLVGLLLIHGIAPEPLSPAFIQFAANGCDLGSLTREFVLEWCPELCGRLDRWLSLGPEDDITEVRDILATCFDMQVSYFHFQLLLWLRPAVASQDSALRGRSAVQHEVLGHEIVYHSLVGSQPPSQTEIKSTLFGLRLPCKNGFDLLKAISSFPGGSSTFLSHTWTSVIHSYESLKPHLTVRGGTTTIMPGLAAPDALPIVLNPRAIVDTFLSGQGIQCPSRFAEVKETISSLIQFDKIDSDAFRSLALCWAVTGRPHIESGDQHHIKLLWVAANDSAYESTASRRATLMALGKISFRTC